MSVVWINGRLVDESDAHIDALGGGVLTGTGVFESMKVLRGQAFARTRHLARLGQSAAIVGVDVPDDEVLLAALHQVLAGSPQATRVRITVYAGRTEVEPSTCVVHVETRAAWDRVAHAMTSPWIRNERSVLTGAKTTSYAENLIARNEAVARGADEALFFDSRGFLSEGSASNVFLEVGGALCTPSPANGCLAGVTAELVCELVAVDVRIDLTASDLATASEAFLTSSTRDVHPLASIDGRELGFAPGPLTQRAMDAFAELQSETDDP